ncbi:ElyC/SanA/YdcF family protein [Paraglaciecola aquimarina]|uniref:ElyC/SanA/YdcF family protein n=1 Tax=Paraglaciecola aquimarina TaxID=1235557 RepID=A0ABU3T292_9ALTE|nr:ElyC/SanA/YdcF family protein [Paraglaciecola aquimarina]MDU0356342.1 ElyC/SanA/YdcF family protein [Paraglaciecola aquimarina]
MAEGSNTETEAAALAPLLKDKYISLVTSARHLPRAVTYFEDLGIKVLPIPVEHLATKKIQFKLGWPSARSLRKSEKAIHEYLGLIYQKFIR